MSIGFIRADKSKSSLLSDCTKGLVGGLKAKLEAYEEDKEGALERLWVEVKVSGDGNLGSS